MKQWASLSPQERAQVARALQDIEGSAARKARRNPRKWREYEALTEDEKHELRKRSAEAGPAAQKGQDPRLASMLD